MTKKELVAAVASKAESTQVKTGKAIDALVEVITETLAKGEEVYIVGLGKFVVKERAAREGRNPSTGEPMTIAAKRVPQFKATKALKDTVKNS